MLAQLLLINGLTQVLRRFAHLAIGKQHRHFFQHRQQAGTLDLDGAFARTRQHGRPARHIIGSLLGRFRRSSRRLGLPGLGFLLHQRRIGNRNPFLHHLRFDLVDLLGGATGDFTSAQPAGRFRRRSGFALVPVFFPAEKRKESHGRMPPDWLVFQCSTGCRADHPMGAPPVGPEYPASRNTC